MRLPRAAVLALAAVLVMAACERPAPRDPTDPGEPTAAPPVAGEPEPTPPAGTPSPGPTPEAAPVETLPPELAQVTLPSLEHPAGRASRGVTEEPCPVPVNPGNGCLYLGALEDLGRGPLGPAGSAATAARAAFWQRVNEAGGIGGYDVDATTYVRDTGADPQAHVNAFAEVHAEVLALAASRGTTATSALLPLLRETGMGAVATSALSGWAASAHVVTVGASACAGAANAADHVLRDVTGGVTVVGHPGALGEDAAAGAALAAARHGAPFGTVEVPVEAEPADLADAIVEVLEAAPAAVVVTTGAEALERLVAGLAGGGYGGTVVALAPAWDERLAARLPAGAAARLQVAAAWAPWTAPTPGHAALREGLAEALAGDAEPSEAHVAGWVSQYPLAAALEAASDAGDLTPEGVREALAGLDGFDSDGMLPADEAGGVAAEARSVISRVDPGSPTGLAAVTGHLAGPTARALDTGVPCPRRPH